MEDPAVTLTTNATASRPPRAKKTKISRAPPTTTHDDQGSGGNDAGSGDKAPSGHEGGVAVGVLPAKPIKGNKNTYGKQKRPASRAPTTQDVQAQDNDQAQSSSSKGQVVIEEDKGQRTGTKGSDQARVLGLGQESVETGTSMVGSKQVGGTGNSSTFFNTLKVTPSSYSSSTYPFSFAIDRPTTSTGLDAVNVVATHQTMSDSLDTTGMSSDFFSNNRTSSKVSDPTSSQSRFPESTSFNTKPITPRKGATANVGGVKRDADKQTPGNRDKVSKVAKQGLARDADVSAGIARDRLKDVDGEGGEDERFLRVGTEGGLSPGTPGLAKITPNNSPRSTRMGMGFFSPEGGRKLFRGRDGLGSGAFAGSNSAASSLANDGVPSARTASSATGTIRKVLSNIGKTLSPIIHPPPRLRTGPPASQPPSSDGSRSTDEAADDEEGVLEERIDDVDGQEALDMMDVVAEEEETSFGKTLADSQEVVNSATLDTTTSKIKQEHRPVLIQNDIWNIPPPGWTSQGIEKEWSATTAARNEIQAHLSKKQQQTIESAVQTAMSETWISNTIRFADTTPTSSHPYFQSISLLVSNARRKGGKPSTSLLLSLSHIAAIDIHRSPTISLISAVLLLLTELDHCLLFGHARPLSTNLTEVFGRLAGIWSQKGRDVANDGYWAAIRALSDAHDALLMVLWVKAIDAGTLPPPPAIAIFGFYDKRYPIHITVTTDPDQFDDPLTSLVEFLSSPVSIAAGEDPSSFLARLQATRQMIEALVDIYGDDMGGILGLIGLYAATTTLDQELSSIIAMREKGVTDAPSSRAVKRMEATVDKAREKLMRRMAGLVAGPGLLSLYHPVIGLLAHRTRDWDLLLKQPLAAAIESRCIELGGWFYGWKAL